MTEQKHDREFTLSRHRTSKIVWGITFAICSMCTCLGVVTFKNDFRYHWTQRRIDRVKAYYQSIMETAIPSEAQLLMTELAHEPEVAFIAPQCIFARHIFIFGSNQNAEIILSEFDQKFEAIEWTRRTSSCTTDGYCYYDYTAPGKEMSVAMTIWTKNMLRKYNGSAYFQWDQWRSQYKTIFSLAFSYTDGCNFQ